MANKVSQHFLLFLLATIWVLYTKWRYLRIQKQYDLGISRASRDEMFIQIDPDIKTQLPLVENVPACVFRWQWIKPFFVEWNFCHADVEWFEIALYISYFFPFVRQFHRVPPTKLFSHTISPTISTILIKLYPHHSHWISYPLDITPVICSLRHLSLQFRLPGLQLLWGTGSKNMTGGRSWQNIAISGAKIEV